MPAFLTCARSHIAENCFLGPDNYVQKMHKRTRLLTYKMEDAIFEDFFVRNKSKTVHENINRLVAEIYRSISYSSPTRRIFLQFKLESV